jgi:hypothetical protein
MKKLLGLLLLLIPAVVLAQSGIDGTWRIDLSKTQLDSKPRVYELKDGMYSCSCDPNVKIKADGQDHKVTSPYAETVSATVVNDNTVEVVGKKDGKVTFRDTMTVAPDGKTMSTKFDFHPSVNDQVVTYNSNFSRIGEPEVGAHAIAGSWKREKIESASDNGLTFTYAMTGDGVNFKQSDGESYSAKFDGKDYSYNGDPTISTVALKKIDSHTFEEIDKKDGKVVGTARISLSPDGKSLTLVSQDMRQGITDTFVADKQEKQEAEK